MLAPPLVLESSPTVLKLTGLIRHNTGLSSRLRQCGSSTLLYYRTHLLHSYLTLGGDGQPLNLDTHWRTLMIPRLPRGEFLKEG